MPYILGYAKTRVSAERQIFGTSSPENLHFREEKRLCLQKKRFRVKIINNLVVRLEVGIMENSERTDNAATATKDQPSPSKEACEIIACTLLSRYMKERDAERAPAKA
jgi:hypothetical protein